MCVAAPIAAIAKKAAEAFLSSKKGRDFIGCVVGIAIFLLLLPVIVILGLFGCLSDGSVIAIDESQIVAAMSSEQQEEWNYQNEVLQGIADVFTEKELSDDIHIAQIIYLAILIGKENGDFYKKYTDCFLNTTDDTTVYDNIESAFGVAFSEEDINFLNQLYG
jgi:hypothetical protein